MTTPIAQGPVECRVGRTPPNNAFACTLLSVAARTGDAGSIRLAAQLADAQPCPDCDFIWTHCRCVTPNAGNNAPPKAVAVD